VWFIERGWATFGFGHENVQLSAGISMQEFFLGENLVVAGNTTKTLLPGKDAADFFLGGISASTDFSAGFLPGYAAGIFQGKDPAGKTGHLGGIPASAENLGGIPVPILQGGLGTISEGTPFYELTSNYFYHKVIYFFRSLV